MFSRRFVDVLSRFTRSPRPTPPRLLCGPMRKQKQNGFERPQVVRMHLTCKLVHIMLPQRVALFLLSLCCRLHGSKVNVRELAEQQKSHSGLFSKQVVYLALFLYQSHATRDRVSESRKHSLCSALKQRNRAHFSSTGPNQHSKKPANRHNRQSKQNSKLKAGQPSPHQHHHHHHHHPHHHYPHHHFLHKFFHYCLLWQIAFTGMLQRKCEHF